MRSGGRDAAVIMGARVVTMVLAIGTQSVLAWLLGRAGRGSYAVCVVFLSILQLFFVVSVDIVGIYFLASKRVSLSEGVIHSLLYGFIGSMLAIATGLVLLQLPLSFVDKAPRPAFYLALADIPFTVTAYVLCQLLTALYAFRWFAFTSILTSALRLSGMLICVWVMGWGVTGAMLAAVASDMLMVAVTLTVYRRKFHLTWVKPSLGTLYSMFRYGIRYYAGKVSNQVNVQVGQIILALFASREEIGLFAVASALTTRFMMIPDALVTAILPRAASDAEGRKALVAQCSRVVAVVCGALLLVLAMFARPIVAALFSPEFLPAVLLIRVLAAGVFIRSAAKVFVPYLLARNRPGIASMAVAVGTGINLVVLWFLMPRIGLIAAAIGMTASYVVSSVILTTAYTRLSGLGLGEIARFRLADWAPLRRLFARSAAKGP